ncbi:hypothetical protein ADH76_04445 [Enterocloster clostridioformis]|uniref:hypothetical protein n=1 Tax=Enterocloster clostridioformis TaxID=1531 RepID=UPI00080C9DFF|nr:hypothetical protein [Enterocloster clostridioformis]ANU44455.1 hypothetical protein A4V08_00155 [Lachnoclostridium sp. YL32]NDO28185.1 hypothetical protein [Enterocloster clostridioformis]OXE70634.1 hypothetical protein ADH76_04445 [Enterocloster clostridioformis]QQR00784.1 hypothetical protein I5Q83_34480 [Enterocloster clostridioformis]
MYRDLLKKLFSEEKESFPEEMFLFDPPQPAKDSTVAVDRAIDNIFFILTLLKVLKLYDCMISYALTIL